MNTAEYTASTYFFDYEHPRIQEIVAPYRASGSSKRKAIDLYLKIRDAWRYNPYRISFRKEDYIASTICQQEDGHCIDKAILYITCLRALGIPARIAFAKVKNHIAAEKLIEKLGTDELTPHGCAEVYLDGKWIKATPAFNKELCALCHVEPLEFDGTTDSVFQEFNKTGATFMEYLEDYGAFDDVPVDFIQQNIRENYPQMAQYFDSDRVLYV